MNPSAEPIAETHRALTEGLVTLAGEAATRFFKLGAAETDTQVHIRLTDMALRCFLGMRLGMRLCQQLDQPPKSIAQAAEPRDHAEPREDREDDRERDYDRDRDYEPVSLERFLGTLKGVARTPEAQTHIPDLLPGLRCGLALAEPVAPAASAAAAPRPGQGRSRLMMTTAAPLRLDLGPLRKTGPP